MLITKRAVSVCKVPREISSASKMELLQRLELSVEDGHPRFVLDCSQLESIGPREIYLLLCCLEEAMKQNGDVRLAQLPPKADEALRRVGVGHLFEIFETSENAISSYEVRTSDVFESAELGSEYAA